MIIFHHAGPQCKQASAYCIVTQGKYSYIIIIMVPIAQCEEYKCAKCYRGIYTFAIILPLQVEQRIQMITKTYASIHHVAVQM